jgi:hypothetical protein
MPLPDDIHDEGKNYMIRLCMLVDDAEFIIEGSKIHACDGCEALIWVKEDQVLPELPEGVELSGHLSLCPSCIREVTAKSGGVETLPQANIPPEILEMAKKYFGI